MLVSESNKKTPVDVDYPAKGYEKDGWSVWQLDKDKENVAKTGGEKVQGIWRWKVDYGRIFDGIAMCPEDNLLVVVLPV
jgi:hypothetical protein